MPLNESQIGAGLRSIRRRRLLLWLVIASYLPEVWITLTLTGSDAAMAAVFALWCLVLWNAVVLVVFSRCPRCGNYFHLKGVLAVYLRSCRHCGLHIFADKCWKE